MSHKDRAIAGVLEIDAWPWDELLEWSRFKPLLTQTDNEQTTASEFQARVPFSIRSVFLILNAFGLSKKWKDNPYVGDHPNPDLVKESHDILLQAGCRSDLVSAFILALIGSLSSVKLEEGESLARYSCKIATEMMIGRIAKPDFDIIVGLLDFAIARHSSEAMALKKVMLSARDGDLDSKKEIVQMACAYWEEELVDIHQCLVSLPGYAKYPEDLGFPFCFALEIECDPKTKVVIAELLFSRGHSEDEERAIKYLLDAALEGFEPAWDMMRDWADRGSHEWVFEEFIEYGRGRFCSGPEKQ